MEFRKESNIPVPPMMYGPKAMSPVRVFMRTLDLGDSFVVEGRDMISQARGAAVSEKSTTGKEFTVRADKTKQVARVWRIK